MDSTGVAELQLSTWQIVAFLCTWLGGVLFNFTNKVTRDGIGVAEYWTKNPLAIAASFIVSLGICITMLLSGETNHITYFTVAFMAENLINRQPAKPHKRDKKRRTEEKEPSHVEEADKQ